MMRCAFLLSLIVVFCLPLGACSVESAIDDPLSELRSPGIPGRQLTAMNMLEQQPEVEEAYEEALHGLIWRPGFPVQVRQEAFQRLERRDAEALKLTIRRQLPRMESWQWVEELCERIADRGWIDLTPGLVSSWARPLHYIEDTDRPEYLALAQLHGADEVVDVVFATFVESKSVLQEYLRFRAWELMHRLGERSRLVELVRSSDPAEDDAMLRDLREVARALGIVPHNREEIRWVRELRKPEYESLWERMQAAAAAVPSSRRSELEPRSLTIMASAYLHEPALLQQSEQSLYATAEAQLRGQKHYRHGSSYGNFSNAPTQRLHEYRDQLTWTDLAAVMIALRAIRVPEVVEHLFDYAERDHEDDSTEYGGLIALDEQGRFEILEFPPRIRRHDERFIASPEMFKASYGAVFHFHYHAQRHRNRDYAGPGIGDMNYADNTRANCLVLTYVSKDALNVDFYRYGRVVIDLGLIHR